MKNKVKKDVSTESISNSTITCQNHHCAYFEKDPGQDIIKWGKTRKGYQKYLCHHCMKVFVETKNTHLYRKQISKSDINIIYRLLSEKHSNRTIEKRTGHHRNTIGNLLKKLLDNPDRAGRIVFLSMKISKSEIDNMWATIRKNQKGI